MDSDDLVVVGAVSIEGLLVLGRRGVAELAVEPLGVVPVDPTEGDKFDVLEALPGR